jgi:non-specific serine/threonine protein kinase
MTPERHQRVKQIFLRACELPPDARIGFLDHTCGDDFELRAMVDSLLIGVTESSVARPDSQPVAAPAERGSRLAAGMLVDGKYLVEASLGAGGMGEVYRARQLALDRLVAIKVLPPVPHPGSGRRFEREARAIARLRHPNVVTVHDLGLAPDVGAYLVMEYVDGRSLRAELRRRGRLPIPEALAILRQVCEGVAAAHAADVLHRDLKPDNILLEDAGERVTAKVADFGIAKIVESNGVVVEALTLTGAVVGSASYMSPEQCRGEAVDARSDVYSLGCVLYEALAGRPPFRADSLWAVLHMHQTAEPVPLRELCPEAPAELERIVARALAKAPEARWQTAAELARALARVAGLVELRGDEPSGTYAPTILDTAPPETHVETLDTAPQACATAPPDNLPRPATRCIGREREVAELSALLEDDAARLVTITGAGGIGKTRLAVEVAARALGRFPDGVFAVGLAPLSDPSLLAGRVANVLGVVESAESSAEEGLAQFLRDKRLLLVLDNFEHLLEGAPLVARLLESAPGLKVLATSQAPLRLRGEREYPIDALALPSAVSAADLAELGRSPSVALFVERATAVRPSFSLTEENANAVAEICTRLDGLPLAIELAAARVKLLTPQDLLARLSDALKLLTGGARDMPERQQTMRAAVRWSYDLLEDSDRALLRRLSVFVGGCTLEACEAVFGEEGADVLESVGSLVDKSLLARREVDGETRFRMLEIVRLFALERLEAEGEADAARLRHAEYYLGVALDEEPKLAGHDAGLVLARLEREHDNFTAALGLMLERDPRACARMAVALWRYWYFRSLYSEGLSWARRALATGAAEPLDRVWLHNAAGGFESVLGEYDVAGEHLSEAVNASRALADQRALMNALVLSGFNCNRQPGKLPFARAHFEEALSIARALGDENIVGVVLINLASVCYDEGDRARVRVPRGGARTPFVRSPQGLVPAEPRKRPHGGGRLCRRETIPQGGARHLRTVRRQGARRRSAREPGRDRPQGRSGCLRGADGGRQQDALRGDGDGADIHERRAVGAHARGGAGGARAGRLRARVGARPGDELRGGGRGGARRVGPQRAAVAGRPLYRYCVRDARAVASQPRARTRRLTSARSSSASRESSERATSLPFPDRASCPKQHGTGHEAQWPQGEGPAVRSGHERRDQGDGRAGEEARRGAVQ